MPVQNNRPIILSPYGRENADMNSPRCEKSQLLVPLDGQPSTRPKWRTSVLLFACCAAVVFVINLTFAIWATARGVGGVAVLDDSGCRSVKIKNTLIHLVINVLSSLLLAGSNFSMQCLMGPSRQMVDDAHAKGSWLDIGIPSVRNFGCKVIIPMASSHCSK